MSLYLRVLEGGVSVVLTSGTARLGRTYWNVTVAWVLPAGGGYVLVY